MCESAPAQTNGGTPATGKYTKGVQFEVASIRPALEGSAYSSSVSLDVSDGPVEGNLFTANAPVHALLLFAFKISDSVQARLVYVHLPAWAKPPVFHHVEARAPGTPTRDQLRWMILNLMVERFGLKYHRETRLADVYVFSLAKAGHWGSRLGVHDPATLYRPGSG